MITLKHLEEFNRVLADYHMSDEAKRLLISAPLVILTGITSAGRNTMMRKLVEEANYHYVVSDTTRPPRENDGVMEQNGVEYWFRSEEEILADLQAGKFVEAAVIHAQQVSGISLRELLVARQRNQIAINEIEVQGVDNILRQAPGSLIPIFVLPPSYDIWMQRWAKRGQMSDAERRNRMESARKELRTALEKKYYHFLVNDNLDKAVAGVQKIVAGEIDPRHETEGEAVARAILLELDK